MKDKEIQGFSRKIDNSLSKLRKSENNLQNAVKEIRNLSNFQAEKWYREKSSKISKLKNEIEEKDHLNCLSRFQDICQDFKSIYDFPEDKIQKALQDIREAKSDVKESENQFLSEVEGIKQFSGDYPLMKQLYERITKKGTLAITEQIKYGVESVLENLSVLEEKASKLKGKFKTNGLSDDFPANFKDQLEEALKENKKQKAEDILSSASDSADKAFQEFKRIFDSGSEDIKSLLSLLSNETKKQTKVPEPNWQNTYMDYPEPQNNSKKEAEEKVAKKYVIKNNEGSLGKLENVLKGVKTHLNLLENLDTKFDEAKEELKKFEIEEDLKEYLEGNTHQPKPGNFTREQSYELSPPKPLKNNPNISVYHELNIENIKYVRQDPIGLVYDSAPPTPIYLWFIDTIIYWAMWDVRLEIEKPLVEEIFDYPNQSIPRPVFEGSDLFVHKALPYHEEFEKSRFRFKLVVFSLRNFSIN